MKAHAVSECCCCLPPHIIFLNEFSFFSLRNGQFFYFRQTTDHITVAVDVVVHLVVSYTEENEKKNSQIQSANKSSEKLKRKSSLFLS